MSTHDEEPMTIDGHVLRFLEENKHGLGILLAGALADLLSTAVGLHAGLVERNAMAAQILTAHGMSGLVVLKVVLVVVIVMAVRTLPRRLQRTRTALLACPGLFWLALAVWNTALLLKI